MMTAILTAAALTGCGTGGNTTDPNPQADNIALDTAMTDAEKEARVFTPEVMWKMGRIGSSSISPDGTQVLYTLTYYNVDDNKGYTSLYVKPISGDNTTARAITGNNGGYNSPAWNADGTLIYLLSNRSEDNNSTSGTTQLWSVRPDGSDLRQLSDIEGGISGFGISPKGDKIWYAADVKVDSVSSADIYDGMTKSKALIYDDLMERHWDCWEDGAYSHIFVADLNLFALFNLNRFQIYSNY